MTRFLCVLLLGLAAGTALADSRTSANYALITEGSGPVVHQASSANYLLDAATEVGATGLSTSASYAGRQGYIGQLIDARVLGPGAATYTVNETAALQLSVRVIYDDGTSDPVANNGPAWSVLSGPVDSVTPGGLASAGTVYRNTVASVRAAYAGLTSDLSVTVVNTLMDNHPPVAGDGISDAWQFAYFDVNNDGLLDNPADAGPGADPDQDGQSNWLEYLAGYAPNDAAQRFGFKILEKNGSTVTFQLSKVIPGTRYRLETTLQLIPGTTWTPVATLSPTVTELGKVLQDAAATSDSRYYRLVLEPAP